jgi:serine/threonine protein kinase
MPARAVIKEVEEIGPYQVLEDLGPAPFGNAWLAVDTRGDRLSPTVILKVIPPSRPGLWHDAALWEILLAETEALGRIYHRGLPDLLEISEREGSLWIAFAYTEGLTLRELLARGERPDRSTLVDWGCQLLEILDEAHAQGVLHRHLGEDEVVVTPEGQLVLTGFGLTQLVFHPQTATPPEQLAGDPCTPQGDLYAVGSLLRRLAFAGAIHREGSHGGRKGYGRQGLGSRDPLLKVLARATSPDPATRYESAVEMAEALREAGRSYARVSPRKGEGAAGRVAVFPGVPQRPAAIVPPGPAGIQELAGLQAGEDGQNDLWRSLVLLVACLLLMTVVLATGCLLVE